LLCTEFAQPPYTFSTVRPPGFALWGKEHKDFQRNYFYRVGRLHGPLQEIPIFESRVTVDPSVKDYWGIPVAALSGSRHPLDRENSLFITSQAETILKEGGATHVWLKGVPGINVDGPSAGSHQAGTCRMGIDPKTSVTNGFGQLHQIDNLFVADGSLIVTNGGFNPALTIMALGYRVGEYIVKNFNSIQSSAIIPTQ